MKKAFCKLFSLLIALAVAVSFPAVSVTAESEVGVTLENIRVENAEGKVTGIVPGDILKVSLDVKTTQAVEITGIAALYSGTRMIGAEAVYKESVSGKETLTISNIMIPSEAENCTMKIMIWDNMGNMFPHIGSTVFPSSNTELESAFIDGDVQSISRNKDRYFLFVSENADLNRLTLITENKAALAEVVELPVQIPGNIKVKVTASDGTVKNSEIYVTDSVIKLDAQKIAMINSQDSSLTTAATITENNGAFMEFEMPKIPEDRIITGARLNYTLVRFGTDMNFTADISGGIYNEGKVAKGTLLGTTLLVGKGSKRDGADPLPHMTDVSKFVVANKANDKVAFVFHIAPVEKQLLGYSPAQGTLKSNSEVQYKPSLEIITKPKNYSVDEIKLDYIKINGITVDQLNDLKAEGVVSYSTYRYKSNSSVDVEIGSPDGALINFSSAIPKIDTSYGRIKGANIKTTVTTGVLSKEYTIWTPIPVEDDQIMTTGGEVKSVSWGRFYVDHVGSTKYVYLKFDISKLTPTMLTDKKVNLNFVFTTYQEITSKVAKIYAIPDAAWTENAITVGNRPELNAANYVKDYKLPAGQAGLNSTEITDAVKAAVEQGASSLTIAFEYDGQKCMFDDKTCANARNMANLTYELISE